MPGALPPELTRLLEQTSRTFYKTLKILPVSVRPQIGLAYLLARTADTIADTQIVSVAQRLEALEQLRRRIIGTSHAVLNFGDLEQNQGLPAERMLLERVEESLAVLRDVKEVDLKLIRQVLETITSGQELDLRRFGHASQGKIVALHNDAELDEYTYRVAGCVGEFWTKICRAHVLVNVALDDAALLTNGIRFGKGLQLVNILRDLPRDLRLGRCYVPQDRLAAAGLKPADLLEAGNASRFRPLYDSYLDVTAAHLRAAWDYTNLLPRGQIRLRLACAWPVLIGVATLNKLRAANILDATQRVKVSRGEIRGIVLSTVVWYPWPQRWKKLV